MLLSSGEQILSNLSIPITNLICESRIDDGELAIGGVASSKGNAQKSLSSNPSQQGCDEIVDDSKDERSIVVRSPLRSLKQTTRIYF